MKKIILNSITLLALVGCSGSSSSDSPAPAGPVNEKPEDVVDEASIDERNIITETMADIQRYAAEFSVAEDLNRIPIAVSSSNMKKEASKCIYSGNRGAKMVLNKRIFSGRIYEKDTGYASPLFNLLVHEIGHCYMNRQHEQALLRKNGYRVRFKIKSSKGTELVYYPSIQASMMQNAPFMMPKSLEKYYVGEIFGKYRAKSLEELQSKYDFDIVKIEKPASYPNDEFSTEEGAEDASF